MGNLKLQINNFIAKKTLDVHRSHLFVGSIAMNGRNENAFLLFEFQNFFSSSFLSPRMGY